MPAPSSDAPAAALPPPLRTKRSRYVPAAVARAVWERDRGCCAWKLENGGVCGSTYKLELDHIDGHALGAGNTVDELRVACRPHQIANMRRLYGDALTNRYVRPKPPPRCSEPVASYGPVTPNPRAGRRPRAARRRGRGHVIRSARHEHWRRGSRGRKTMRMRSAFPIGLVALLVLAAAACSTASEQRTPNDSFYCGWDAMSRLLRGVPVTPPILPVRF